MGESFLLRRAPGSVPQAEEGDGGVKLEMKTNVEYTQKFFRELEKLVDKRPHRCRQCGIADGEYGILKNGDRKKFPAIVRLCVSDPWQPPNVAANIAMYCTKCRKPDQVWRTPRRIKPGGLPQLGFEL